MPLGTNKPVIVRQVHGLGRYGGTQTALSTAAQFLQDQTSGTKLIVAAGGNVAALAASGISFGTDANTKILALYGGANAIDQNNRGIGINVGLPADQSGDPLPRIVNTLHDPNLYNLPYSQLCLFFNGNSQINLVKEWDNLTSKMAASYDATLTDVSGENHKIQFPQAIDNALDKTDDSTNRAIVITSDPFFSLHRAQIIRRLKKKKRVVVCFPFQEYVADALEADFTKDTCMLWGPSLAEVYATLGHTAGDMLNGVTVTKTTNVPFHYFGKS